MIEIKINDADVQRLQRLLIQAGEKIPRVMSRALNRTASSVRTRLKDFISERTGIKKGVVLKSLIMDRATYQVWRSAIRHYPATIPVIKLQPSQTSLGVTYKNPVSKTRVLIRHAFIAVGDRRGKQVWLRSKYVLGRAKYIEWKDRVQEALYIQKDYSGITGEIMKQYIENYGKVSSDELAKNIHDQVELILKRRAS